MRTPPRRLEYEDLAQLKYLDYLDAVIWESMRLHDVGLGTVRRCGRACSSVRASWFMDVVASKFATWSRRWGMDIAIHGAMSIGSV